MFRLNGEDDGHKKYRPSNDGWNDVGWENDGWQKDGWRKPSKTYLLNTFFPSNAVGGSNTSR